MLGFGMPELIVIAVIICVVIFGLILKGKGSSSFVNILTILIGVGIIVFASMCFTSVPFIGTVFALPGDNIMNAKIVNPAIRIFAFLLGGAFAIMGVFFQLKIGSDTGAKESAANTIVSENRESKLNLSGIKEAKELLDYGAITEEEFNKIKSNYIGK